MKHNSIIIALGVVILAVGFFGLGVLFFNSPMTTVPPTVNSSQPTTTTPPPTVENRVTVSASTSTLAEFTKKIGSDRINFVEIAPDGIGAHDFEPTAQDVATLQDIDLFIIHGAGFAAWAERISPELQKNGVEILTVADSIELLPAAAGEEYSDDPHVWLDPVRVQQMVSIIRDQLIAIDLSNEAAYTTAAQEYTADLEQLHQEYTTGLRTCESRTVIVAHDAFAYLGVRYNLELLPIAGISPESEPSARHIAELADLAGEQGVTTIFFETLTSPALAQTLAQEAGATTDVLNPLEGLTSQERLEGKTYVSVMRENLEHLRTALRCE